MKIPPCYMLFSENKSSLTPYTAIVRRQLNLITSFLTYPDSSGFGLDSKDAYNEIGKSNATLSEI